MAAQGQGRAFGHVRGKEEWQRSRRHFIGPGKALIRERRAEQHPSCRETRGTPAPWEA